MGKKEKCDYCGGSGIVECDCTGGLGRKAADDDCLACGGSGRHSCPACIDETYDESDEW